MSFTFRAMRPDTGMVDANGYLYEHCSTCSNTIMPFEFKNNRWECRVCHKPLNWMTEKIQKSNESQDIKESRRPEKIRTTNWEGREAIVIFQPAEWNLQARPEKEYKPSSGRFNSETAREAQKKAAEARRRNSQIRRSLKTINYGDRPC